jgi:hypothetical protein
MDGKSLAVLAGLGVGMILALIVLLVVYIIAEWKIFTKAGEAGWKSLIPIYREYILYKISWKPMWFWIMTAVGVLCLLTKSIPAVYTICSLASAVIAIIALVKLSKSFGHGGGFAVGLILLSFIFMLILGFGSSQYVGPEGIPAGGSAEVPPQNTPPTAGTQA